ncbi:MAG: GntR family transcriptional regulator [Oscillospiraceae bacterium]
MNFFEKLNINNPEIINSTIQEQVYQIIRRDVINRVFREGEQLKEAELAKRFNVSRSPVREALHRLAGDGILTIIPNRGIFVRELTEKYVVDALDLRCMLEERGLSRANEMMTPDTRAVLIRMRDEMEKLIKVKEADLTKYAALDTAFHNLIIGLNNNIFVGEIAEKTSALNAMLNELFFQSPERAMRSQRENMNIIDSMLAGDTKKAIDAYKAHISGTAKCVVGSFNRRCHEEK